MIEIHVRSECHSFLGLTWWTSRPVGFSSSDICGPPKFRSRSVDKSEARAVEWAKKRFMSDTSRRRSFEV